MKITAPKIDKRSFQDLLKQMQSMVPFYTPEWNPNIDKESGQALMKIYLQMQEQIITRLNKVPDKNFIKFLDMLGIKMLPAQSASVQVTFKLAEGTAEHVVIPKGTLLAGEGADGNEVTFETQGDLRVMPATLKEIYSFEASQDEIYVHTKEFSQNEKFHFITGSNKQEHSLYLGHTDLFSQTNPSKFTIDFEIVTGVTGGILDMVWEYWGGERWVELKRFDNIPLVDDPNETTQLFRHSGKMVISKEHKGEIALYELLGTKSRWLRCRLKNKLPASNSIQLPAFNTIRLSVEPIEPFAPELAFNNDIPLNLKENPLNIKPFGELPVLFDTFYIASDEAFSKKGASITLEIDSEWATDDTNKQDLIPNAVLSWEYWNGRSWQNLHVVDRTNRFEKEEKITFTCPLDIEKIKVNGEEKYWVRVRIIDGDYGREIILVPHSIKIGNIIDIPNVEIEKGKIYYPVITSLTINYQGTLEKPQQCFSLNNLDYEDHIKAVLDTQNTFTPYKKFSEQTQGVLLGFDKQMVGGPFGILFNVTEQVVSETDNLKMEWFYWSGEQWLKINAQDNTENLTRIGLFNFSIPVGFLPRKLFNTEQYWLKGSVTEGQFKSLDSIETGIKVPEIIGIFPNSTSAVQASVVEDEVLGTSDLTANQAFQLLNPLIISQQLLVTEPTQPTADETHDILKEEGKAAIEELKDELDEIQGYRVWWHEVDDFYDSKPKSRHYVVDKRQGIILFGDGISGLVPPRGVDNIRINYHFGGGKNGNVGAGKITGLKNAIPFINEVTNHLPADGGSETETIEEVIERGPKQLKNRDRAVTREDFEALAKNASRKIARAKCLPNADENGNFALGHVTVLIVPNTQTADEKVSRELCDVVSQNLNRQSSNLLFPVQDIHVRGANYIKIHVEVTVVPVSLEATARVDEGVMKALKRYIHPLTGGRQGMGWEFGKSICRSEIFALLESISDVDYVKELTIYADGVMQTKDDFIGKDVLPFSGEHKVSINFGTTASSKDKTTLSSECNGQIVEFCPRSAK
jgi:hypothetical protein